MHCPPLIHSASHLVTESNEVDQPFVNPYWLLPITESQKHRMFRVGRNLWGSSSPTLIPKQVHLEQVEQDLIQAGFEYLQRRRYSKEEGDIHLLSWV